MKVRVLGGHGGLAKGFAATSFLIDEKLLIDAGAVASTLSIEDQLKIDHILISHCHLDHTKDLAFLCDNCFGLKDKPFYVHTHKTVKEIIKKHLLNDVIWPDFTKLPNESQPTMTILEKTPEEKFQCGEYSIIPVPVNHQFDAMGFIVEKNGESILFTLDTGPTERIWEVSSKIKNLKAIFTEVSFPNRMQNVADISQHLTTKTLNAEIPKMPKDIPIILTHLKPNYQDEIMEEINALKNSRIRILENDGVEFNF